MKAVYPQQPETISYMVLPTGQADVWLRKNIQLTTEDDDGYDPLAETWECDEVSFRTSLSLEEIEANFDTIFENGGVTYDEDAEEEVADGITLADRVEALEESQLETLALLDELLG